jgi:hypothetical protein
MTEMLNQDSRPEDDQSVTREAWLHRAIEAFRPRFAEIGLPLNGLVLRGLRGDQCDERHLTQRVIPAHSEQGASLVT